MSYNMAPAPRYIIVDSDMLLVHDVGSYNAQVGAALYGLNLLCLIVISGKPCQIARQLIDIIYNVRF